MSWLYRTLARPWLFSFDSEDIHNRTLAALSWASQRRILVDFARSFSRAESLPVQVFGLHFPNPLGLAAGMDKHGVAVPMWEAMGFGFSEVGGVTWKAQPGNPTPRMFRVVQDEALINRMGFNNPGATALAAKLETWRTWDLWPGHPVGVNLGKSKDTPLESAAEDYAQSFRALWKLADFFVVNVSSPNTPNLRQLQDKSALLEILQTLRSVNTELAADAKASRKPVLVKVAPDLSWNALDEIVEISESIELDGIVATNTTIERPSPSNPVYAETGGLSGRPLAKRSNEVIRHLSRQTRGALPIIGVGGIFDAEDAWEKVMSGATLIQIYTGLVFHGPGIISSILSGLREKMEDRQIRTWTDLSAYRKTASS